MGLSTRRFQKEGGGDDWGGVTGMGGLFFPQEESGNGGGSGDGEEFAEEIDGHGDIPEEENGD